MKPRTEPARANQLIFKNCGAASAAQGLRALVYPDADKIGKQIKYADGQGTPRPRRGGGGDSRGIEATWLSNSVI